MKLEFQSEHKSIPRGGKVKLPKMVILTGLNGAGKTHLLEAINENKVGVKTNDQRVKSKLYIESGALVPNTSPRAGVTASEEAYTLLSQWCDQLIDQPHNSMDERTFVKRNPPRVTNPKHQKLFPVLQKVMLESFQRGKKKFTKSEIRNIVSKDDLVPYDDAAVFQQSFSISFLRYFQDVRQNQFHRFLREKENEQVTALTDREFEALKGLPPWDTVNETMASMGLPYKINRPRSHEDDFVAVLTNTENGTEVGFDDLSSGEQSLCSLAIALYQGGQGLAFPELLLLDEPDAHLHPQMTDRMLYTLKNVILPRLSCGLILTTHSPSTCALAEQDHLYLMNSNTRRPNSVEIDQALDALCVGLPMLSIRKERERQIFVESDVDSEIYTSLWAKLKDTDHGTGNGVSLNFVSSGSGFKSGNCSQAIDMCTKMREAGSTSVYALIDRDDGNSSSEYIKILGEGERYSIENFILSPISVMGLIIHRYGDGDGLPTFLSDISMVSIGDINVERLQQLTDNFCKLLHDKCIEMRDSEDLSKKFPEINLDENLKMATCNIEGTVIELPKWFLNSKGHVIEDLIKSTFPGLEKYGRNAGDVMKAVVRHVLHNHLSFVPRSFLDSIRIISTHT